MLTRFTTIVVLLLMGQSLLIGQSLDSFSDNRGEFISELKDFMTASKRTMLEEIYDEFEKPFKSGVYTDEEFSTMLATTNRMLEFKMKASPQFKNYLKCLSVIKKTENNEENFIEFHVVLDSLLSNIENRKVKPYNDFLDFSQTFFGQKALRYSKNGVTWTARSEDYNMTFEDKLPVVKYEKLDLVATRKKDSIKIQETSGNYFPTLDKWQGSSGKVTWARFENSDVFFELGTYEIETKKTEYKVDSAVLHYPDFFPSTTVVGSFVDKVIVSSKRMESSYPRFESKKGVLEINDIGEGIKYVGGFRLQGTTVYGYGTKLIPAKITVRNKSAELAYKGLSQLFVIRKGEQLSAERVETTIYFDQDSIYHPSVNIKFNIKDKTMSLYRGARGSDRNPFFNSSTDMNIDTDNLDWYMDKDSLVIGKQLASISRDREANFESLKYFSEGDYRKLQNIASTNPIAILKVTAEKEGTNFLDAGVVAKRLNSRFDVKMIESLLYDLVSRGFINYDSEENTIEVKDKVFHYADASQEKVDYDYLKIISKSDSTNASILLKEKKIKASGVKSVEFSHTQRVALKPTQNLVTIKEDRNMDFDGRVFAGLSVLEGKDFKFDYEKNYIEMDSVRFFDFFIPTEAEDKNGNPIALSVGSRIEHASGVLLIDAPNNKSGKEDIASFPSFNSKGPSYVFYDSDSTQNGAYKRDSFYFQLDEFFFNSLDKLQKEDVQFTGNMVSANIFPDFEETLVLRLEDQSLGFTTNTPSEGYPAYQEKGDFNGEIDLSNKGFRGVGDVKYLRATFKSEDIVFRPKKLTATADRFDLEEDRVGPPEIPQAVGDDVSIDWRPYKDSMYVKTKIKPFELFDEGIHNLKGTLILTPGGLKADGIFKWDKGKFTSKLMSFGAKSVDADTSTLQIFAFGSDDLAFDTRNVKADLDFDKQEGKIKANSTELSTTMPYNQYQTSMNEFLWNMKEESITFLSEPGKLGSFMSIHPDQDSLLFQGENAFYDLKTNLLKVSGVPVIQTCDAYVYTEKGDVEIQKGGVMTTLENARIVADTVNKYHVINRATVDVKGKKEYTANGFYEYNVGDKEQEIKFDDILGTRVGKGKRSEKKTVTRATGEVTADDEFFIDHKTEFRGKIRLEAESKNLDFDGFAKLSADKLPGAEWFSVQFSGDKKDLAITFDEPKNYKGEPMRTGIFLSKETAKMYPSVMQGVGLRKDRPILQVKGLFKYNKPKDIFTFGDSLKIVDNASAGNKLVFDAKTGGVEVEGKFVLGSGLEYIKVAAAGKALTAFDQANGTNLENAQYKVVADVMTGIDMIIPEKLLKIMIIDIKSTIFDAKVIDYSKEKEFYTHALAEFIPDAKAYNKVVESMTVSQTLDIPKKLNKHTFFFSHIPMVWNPEYQSLVSKGKVALNSINGEIIDRWLTAYVEFKMPTNEDDRLYIYIKSPSDYYYYFGYKQGVLEVVSNNTLFNEELLGLKKKETLVKMKNGEFYEILPIEPSKAQMFIARVKEAQKVN